MVENKGKENKFLWFITAVFPVTSNTLRQSWIIVLQFILNIIKQQLLLDNFGTTFMVIYWHAPALHTTLAIVKKHQGFNILPGLSTKEAYQHESSR